MLNDTDAGFQEVAKGPKIYIGPRLETTLPKGVADNLSSGQIVVFITANNTARSGQIQGFWFDKSVKEWRTRVTYSSPRVSRIGVPEFDLA